MGFHIESFYVLILLSLPFQFNLITDSYNILKVEMAKEWKSGRELTYYENYFAEKITYYVGIVTAILLVFIYYKVRRMRLIISVGFFLNAVVWLFYLIEDENHVYILILVRGLQGIFLSLFQMSHCIYILHFVNPDMKCFFGGLFQGTMFTGLLFLNILFYSVNWRAVIVICSIQSILFSTTIWLVPEIHIKPKRITKESLLNRTHRWPLFVMIFIMVIQQLSGIGILLGQLPRILDEVGMNMDPFLQSILFDFVAVLATFIAAFITGYVGTRLMWSFSAFGLCIGLVLYGSTLKFEMRQWVATLGVFVYFLFYGLGEGPIPWFLCGTLFPEEVRIESAAVNVCENFFFFPILHVLWNGLNKGSGEFGSIVFSFVDCFLAIFCGLMIPSGDVGDENGINVI